ncbi:MAG: hypothetical protein B7Y77_00115, partial [Bradyrhizobium sp. 35-63-5]
MPRPEAGSRITQATVDAAIRDAAKKVNYEHPDPECKGLSLRVAGKGVTWSFRGPRLGGKNRRWTLGDQTTAPKEARSRAWAVRSRVEQGIDPQPLVIEFLTGLKPQEQLDLRIENRPSWRWEEAIDRYEAWLKKNKRRRSMGDSLTTLRNTPELRICKGRLVCDIVREEIEEAVEKVRLRGVKTHHKKVLTVVRRFFNWMSEGTRRRETSVPVNFLLGAKADPPLRNVLRRVFNKGIPDTLPIGRALAFARSGVLGDQPSAAIELVMGTAQRRHPVVAMTSRDVKPIAAHPGEFVWFMPPSTRKTADRLQSSDPHQVPLVGFTVGVIEKLERRLTSSPRWIDGPLREAEAIAKAKEEDDKDFELVPWDWYFPVARPRYKGVANLQSYMSESTLNHNIAAMPGVVGVLSPHPMRRAFASYGKLFGGFTKGQAAMILDHLEGEGDDVTRGHYDLDPRIEEKRAMMLWWTGWLEEQCAAAIAADTMLDMSTPAKRKENFER